jgi:hypothetical protein
MTLTRLTLRLSLFSALLAVSLAASCSSSKPPEGVDGGNHHDGGNNPNLACDVAAQNCTTGSSCIHYQVDGGLGSKCFPGACDLVAQDCAASDKCTYVADGGSALERGCVADGTANEGDACTGTATSNTCKKGLTCALKPEADGGSSAVCLKFCNSNSNCTGTDLCYVVLTIAGNEERPLVCGPPPSACDPLTQNCPTNSDGCYPTTSGPGCYPAGTTADGQSCVYTNECQKGSACVGQTSPGTCRKICQYPSGSPSCTSGTCTPISGQADAGVCI